MTRGDIPRRTLRLPGLAGTGGTRPPPRDHPRLCAVRDSREQPPQFNTSGQLALLLEGSADRGSLGFGHAERRYILAQIPTCRASAAYPAVPALVRKSIGDNPDLTADPFPATSHTPTAPPLIVRMASSGSVQTFK